MAPLNGIVVSNSLSGVPLHRNTDFYRLWWIGFVTFLLRWLEILVFGLFAYQYSGSALTVALLTMVRVLPLGLFGAIFGALAQRIDRHAAMVGSLMVLLLSAVVLVAIAYADRLQIWHLAVASFINGTVWAADNPVRRAMVGEIVGPAQMGSAMSIEVGTSNATRLAGPTLGGYLLGSFGIQGAFVLSLLLYLLALVVALGVSYRNDVSTADGESLFASLAAAYRVLWSNKRFTGLLWLTVVFNLFAWPVLSLVPVIAVDQLALGVAGVGLLASMDGFGALVFALVLVLISRPSRHGKIYTCGVVVFLLFIPLLAYASNVVVAALALFCIGVGQAGFAVMQATITFALAPLGRRSQAMGMMTSCIGVGPLGFAFVGLLAEATSASAAAVVSSLVGLLVVLLSRNWWRALWAG